MKKYYIFILALVASAVLSSCNKQLELRTNGTTDMSAVFASRNMTRGYLNACYSYISNQPLYVSGWTDDAVHSNAIESGSDWDIWYNAGVTSSNFGTYNYDGDPWGNYFQGIRKCNVFIANIDDCTADLATWEKAGFKAQALTLRAYYYLQLMKRYGELPIFTEDLGTSHDYSTDELSSVAEVTEQILADCDAAIATADSDAFSYVYGNQQWGMMTKAVAQAIRAESVMWAISPLLDDGFDKAKAVQVAADALNNLLTHDYSLYKIATADYNAYANYFLYNPNDERAKDKETILGGSQCAVWQNCGIPTLAGVSSAGCCPTQELVDAYDMANGQQAITGYEDAQHLKPIVNKASGYNEAKPYENRDPRFYATVFYNGSKRGGTVINTSSSGTCGIKANNIKYTHTGYYMRKYAHDGSNRNGNSDGYIRNIRLAEVYFNFAEVALAVVGADTKITPVNLSAMDAVNAVRARVGMPAITDAANFEARYRNERRVEFAMEADRYFSVRRWKTLSSTAVVTGMSIDGTKYERFAFENRPTCEDKYLLYPINLTEAKKIQNNTGTSWQNAGWE